MAVRKSLGTRNWEAAQKIVKEWENEGVQEVARISVSEACDRFYADCVARRLSDASLRKYALLVAEFKREFRGGLESVKLDDLREFRERWAVAPITARKRLERLRTFYKFAVESGWVDTNLARLLRAPQGQNKPVIPFTDEEIEKVVWATEVYPDTPPGRRTQVKAFVLVLRYSGLRIGDVISLRKTSLEGDRLFLRTAKTGTQVYIPLPEKVVESLQGIGNGTFYFWTGLNLRSAVSNWHRTFTTLFRLAGVEGHPHMFRHTFAKDLLSRGVPIEDVAVILGHSSPAITAKHYNQHVRERQLAIERNIERAWKIG